MDNLELAKIYYWHMNSGGGGINWILADGTWDDIKLWVDESAWIDAA